jgi:hypothetical protein
MVKLSDSQVVEMLHTQHEDERKKLAENEAFAIGVLQAVCAATAFGIVSQFDTIIENAGHLPVLLVLSALVLGLAAAVAAAFCRHHYKMWDVKAVAAREPEDKVRREGLSACYLQAMRKCMITSVVLTIGSMLLLVGALWATYLYPL